MTYQLHQVYFQVSLIRKSFTKSESNLRIRIEDPTHKIPAKKWRMTFEEFLLTLVRHRYHGTSMNYRYLNCLFFGSKALFRFFQILHSGQKLRFCRGVGNEGDSGLMFLLSVVIAVVCYRDTYLAGRWWWLWTVLRNWNRRSCNFFALAEPEP